MNVSVRFGPISTPRDQVASVTNSMCKKNSIQEQFRFGVIVIRNQKFQEGMFFSCKESHRLVLQFRITFYHFLQLLESCKLMANELSFMGKTSIITLKIEITVDLLLQMHQTRSAIWQLESVTGTAP